MTNEEFFGFLSETCEQIGSKPNLVVFNPSGDFLSYVEFDCPNSVKQVGDFSVVQTDGLSVRFADGLPVIDGSLSSENYLLVYHQGATSRNGPGQVPDFRCGGGIKILTATCVDVTKYRERYYTEKFGYVGLFLIETGDWSLNWDIECPFTDKLKSFELTSCEGEIKNESEKFRSQF